MNCERELDLKQNIKKYFLPCLLIFAALCLLFRPELLLSLWHRLSGAAVPIFLGIIFAAVIDPGVCAFERALNRLFKTRLKGSSGRYLSITLVYLLIAAVFSAVVWIVIPRLIDSAALFAGSIDGYYRDLRLRYDSSQEASWLIAWLDRLLEYVSDKLPDLFGRTFSATADFLKGSANVLLGLVLSVYFLAGKEHILDFIRSGARSAMSPDSCRKASRVISAVNRSLVNFISGQLTEAVVLGTLCFCGMVLLGFEYPLLISTIIGVTALIPVAGAFIGAIPSALVLFLAKPSSALWFIVFIIVLQQVENNLIYPKIVGKSVGMPSVLILIAIISGAELGGAAGIMLGIPLLSAVYTLIKESIEERSHRLQE